MLDSSDRLLLAALDAGGDLDAATTRRDHERDAEHLKGYGYLTYVAEAGSPAVFRLTEEGRRQAMKLATR